ncbi:immobilization antigen (macronuclear) [Tetrahymena thermophila SB210]|uniref:Immobilization antigen n=1 Tax=Tetrahymena thermophila (strain SB210) TaxID=312017 RepID=Q227U0_TETTS|nr:immobilization antigen [Tetrahymena thermophila SB210]EAR81556.1 immobilization antigen [Tetrahymena thermophila SB210]|eukprot:XP_001029219.1 immobilization antigen [Tetrahymena thermophila SB210]
MNKLLAILAVISNISSSVNAGMGLYSNCGTPNQNSNSLDCKGCGTTSAAIGFFVVSPSPNCKVRDCTVDPGDNLNGWMCVSCSQSVTPVTAYGIGKKFLQGNACTNACSNGYVVDYNYICQPVQGADVPCGTANQAGGNASSCNGCGTTRIQNYFQPSAANNCKVINCFNYPSYLNSWMCKSCYGNPVAHQIYQQGQFFNGSVCVASCPIDQVPDQNNVCQPILGADVGCGTTNQAGGQATDCQGCGANSTIQALFKVSATPSCDVIDCTANPGANLNGWMCKSCNGNPVANAVYSAGKLFSVNTCVATCPVGYSADINNICQLIPVPGADVACGTAGTTGGKATDCKGCGTNATIQALFTPSATPNCEVIDCTANPGANLNGWMCKSCNGVTKAHTAYAAGKFFSVTACVASCSNDQSADSNNICQANSIRSPYASSNLLTLAFTMLLLFLIN